MVRALSAASRGGRVSGGVWRVIRVAAGVAEPPVLPVSLRCGVGGTGFSAQLVSAAVESARWAVAKTALYGQPDAMASLMRRTLMVTRAPILNSLRRMVPQVASARSVVARARRRRLSGST